MLERIKASLPSLAPAEQRVARLVLADPRAFANLPITELANRYHKFYNSCRVKDAEHCVCQARIALCTATKNVISNALTLLKITVPESM